MKRVIRSGLFETNSSSVHSLIMCSEEEYESFKNKDSLIDEEGAFISLSKLKDLTDEELLVAKEEYEDDIGENWDKLTDKEKKIFYYAESGDAPLSSFDSFFRFGDEFHDEYVTKNGEKVVAFGYYGWDG